MNIIPRRHADNMAVKIANVLRAELQENADAGNSSFFSARQLAGRFNCSHQTVNNALNILAGEGWLERKQGAGSWSKPSMKHMRIACMVDTDFSKYRPENYSAIPLLSQKLFACLEKHNCEYRIFSINDLRRGNFSPHIFDNYAGLIADTRFSDRNSRQLANEFPRPKLWPWTSSIINVSGSQVVGDHMAGFSRIFQKARRCGIRKIVLHNIQKSFQHIMHEALIYSGWSESETLEIFHENFNTQLAAYKYALNMVVEPDTLHACEADMLALGFFEALLDRGFKPGEFNVSGNGNIESLGFLPLGRACLTTLKFDIASALETAVEQFLHKVADPTLPDAVIRVAGNMIVRESAFYNASKVKKSTDNK
ncbi:MAG: GntR family transcriptional regulator [Lentisphaerae bacterium]|nr:GntR family transcriptional regulator [Lentisphaerota bacterium]